MAEKHTKLQTLTMLLKNCANNHLGQKCDSHAGKSYYSLLANNGLVTCQIMTTQQTTMLFTISIVSHNSLWMQSASVRLCVLPGTKPIVLI